MSNSNRTNTGEAILLVYRGSVQREAYVGEDISSSLYAEFVVAVGNAEEFSAEAILQERLQDGQEMSWQPVYSTESVRLPYRVQHVVRATFGGQTVKILAVGTYNFKINIYRTVNGQTSFVQETGTMPIRVKATNGVNGVNGEHA